jgi:hypothetical protein
MMRTAFFFLGSVAVGMFGGQVLASFEPLPSERAGAQAFLFLLSLVAATLSTLSYTASFQRLGRQAKWLAGLLGGIAAGGTFCASLGAFYLGLDFVYPLLLSLTLPALTGLLWPLLSAKSPDRQLICSAAPLTATSGRTYLTEAHYAQA